MLASHETFQSSAYVGGGCPFCRRFYPTAENYGLCSICFKEAAKQGCTDCATKVVAPCPEDLLRVRSVALDIRRSVDGNNKRLTCVPCLQAKDILPYESDVARLLAERSLGPRVRFDRDDAK